jgi:hypothetical protein
MRENPRDGVKGGGEWESHEICGGMGAGGGGT